jgi:hypothetical protein
MIDGDISREPVRVTMHLNEGYTKVVLERTVGLGMADGGIEWDIPTEIIPPYLRPIGSRFILVSADREPQENDPEHLIQRRISELRVEEIDPGESAG